MGYKKWEGGGAEERQSQICTGPRIREGSVRATTTREGTQAPTQARVDQRGGQWRKAALLLRTTKNTAPPFSTPAASPSTAPPHRPPTHGRHLPVRCGELRQGRQGHSLFGDIHGGGAPLEGGHCLGGRHRCTGPWGTGRIAHRHQNAVQDGGCVKTNPQLLPAASSLF